MGLDQLLKPHLRGFVGFAPHLPRPFLFDKMGRDGLAPHFSARLFAEPFYRLAHGEADHLPGLVIDRGSAAYQLIEKNRKELEAPEAPKAPEAKTTASSDKRSSQVFCGILLTHHLPRIPNPTNQSSELH